MKKIVDVGGLKIPVIREGIFVRYITNLYHLMPQKLALNIGLMVLISLTEGISLILLIPLLQLVGVGMGQGSLYQIEILINKFFTSMGLQPSLIAVLALYMGVVTVIALLRRWQMIMSYEIDYHFAAHLRKRLYEAIINSNWLFFSKNKASDFAHALTYEIERIGTGTSQFLTLLTSIMLLLVFVVLALKLAGLVMGLIIIAGLILIIFLRKKVYSSQESGEKVTATSRNIYSSIIQHLDGMKTIKTFNMEKDNVNIFSNQTDQVVHSYLQTIRSYADVRFLFDVGTVFILALIVIFLIQIIHISTAALLVLIYLFIRMVPQFSIIQTSYQYVLNMLPAFNNVIDLEKRCQENMELLNYEDDGQKLRKGVSLDNVSFSYQKDHYAVKDVDITIIAGQTTAIAGPSGAGKSTLADLVMGLIQPESGAVNVDGLPTSLNWRNQIGYVAQDTFLFNESIRFNLLVAQPDADENELREVLEMVAAYEFVSKLPKGLDTIIGDRGARLSGGERQRLALARAILRKPKLLILDEATSNLDSENEQRIMRAIDKLHGEITILVIAHRLSTIKNADYIYLLSEGRVIESGTWDELLQNEEGWFWDICDAQGVEH